MPRNKGRKESEREIKYLKVGVVSGTDGAHGRWLIACVRLCRVFKVGIRSSRTVNTYITSHGNMGATVRLGHNGNDANTGCRSDGLGLDLGKNLFLPLFWNRGNDIYSLWGRLKSGLAGVKMLQGGQIDGFVLSVRLDDVLHNLRETRHHFVGVTSL
jgi:hypothetical protein